MSLGSHAPARRRFSSLVRPLSLEGTWEGVAFAVLAAIALLLLFLIDTLTPRGPNLGSLGSLPVLATAWLVSRRLTGAVALLALALRLGAVAMGVLYLETAVAQIVNILIVTLIGRIAAEYLARNQDATNKAELVSRIARIVTSSDRLNLILYGVLDEMSREGLGGALVALMDEHGELYPAAVDGSADREAIEERLLVVSGLMQRAATEGRTIRIDELPAAGGDTGSAYPARSAVVVPLRAAGSIVGVLELDDAEPRHFSDAECLLLEQLALAVSGAVQRAGALQLADEMLRRRVKDLELLLETSRALSSSLDLDHLLGQIVHSSAGILAHSGRVGVRASIFRVDGDVATFLADYDEQGTRLVHEHFPTHQHLGLVRAIDKGSAATWDFARVEEPLASLVDRTGVRSGAFAPIRAGGALFGVLSCASRDAREYEPQELRLLEGIADLAGLAISNSQRLDVELTRGQQLRDHAERMQALERTKSEFLRLASHELRGPIAILRGYISMLNEGTLGELPESARKVMPMLTEKVTEMNRLIDQMLETARLEDTRLQLHLQLLDLVEMVTAAVSSLEARARSGNCEIALKIGRNDQNGSTGTRRISVLADPDRISTIVVNLLDNAIKYSPDGGLITCDVWEADGRALVKIADRGLGIDAADLPRLFTRFGRIVTPDNSHIPGTGLGLYLARELARMHGGDITVASVKDEGTTFLLTLPVAVERLHRLAGDSRELDEPSSAASSPPAPSTERQ